MSARPQVTITLGRSGQVVKRAASDVSQSDYVPSSGGKRPIRERLGSNMEPHSNGSQPKNKRQRRENHDWSDDDLNNDKPYMSDRLVGRDDLRYKLMHKNLSGRSKFVDQEPNHVDLRDKLSRNTKMSSRFDAQEDMPGSRAAGLGRRIAPTRSADDLLHMDSLRKSYSSWTLDAPRHRSPDRLIGSSRGISPPRSFNEMRHVPSVRSLDAPRPSTFTTKSVDASRSAAFMNKSGVPVEVTKPIVRVPPTSDIVHKSSYMSEQPLTVAGLLRSLGLEKYAILFQAEETCNGALHCMHLAMSHDPRQFFANVLDQISFYPRHFKDQTIICMAFSTRNSEAAGSLVGCNALEALISGEGHTIVCGKQGQTMVDMTALKQMGDNDLKELGIPMGPRKKILLAVQPRSRRHS